jgi:hypothetical protein
MEVPPSPTLPVAAAADPLTAAVPVLPGATPLTPADVTLPSPPLTPVPSLLPLVDYSESSEDDGGNKV